MAAEPVVALFAGPGGACEGILQATGSRPVGIESDPDACATRAAAGHLTIRADVHHYRPPPNLAGLWASPPCQIFSQAGTREGRSDIDALTAAAAGDWKARARVVHGDAKLILRSLDWAVSSDAGWVAMEQVPDVVGVWRAARVGLERHGFRSWAGVLNAADFGVPQTRRRAILMARRGSDPVFPPEPTHTGGDLDGLFGRLAPWVSMADALWWSSGVTTDRAGWAWVRPATTVMCDSRVWPPGHKVNQSDRDRLGGVAAAEVYGDRAGSEAVRCSPSELGVLQGFRADYPWRGGVVARCRQVGNAVPPGLAAAIVGALV